MKSRKSGFSIIEVVLVLGIAGLIFMMAFIALPSLWASQRDADRKSRVIDLITDLKTYQTNNSRGALPVASGNPNRFSWSTARSTSASDTDSWKAFVRDYVNGDFEDPTGTKISFYVVNCLSSTGGDLSNGAPCAYKNEFKKVNASTLPETGVDYTMYVAIGAVCNSDQAVKSSNTRDVAVVYVLERAGRYCYNT